MTLIYFLIVIGILVFVHEFGHFIMAKRAGVRVEKFSLGMGPKLFGYKKGDTEYVISALPLGGYVKMAGENPDEEPTGATDEFQSKTVWQRAKIAATGPLTNIVLAFIVMPLVFMIGTYTEGPAKVGYVEKGSPAERAGFQAGDVIEKINGRSISDWTKALSLIAVNPETDVTVTVDRQGREKDHALSARTLGDGAQDRHLRACPRYAGRGGQAEAGIPGGEGGAQGQRQDPRRGRQYRLSLEPVLRAGKGQQREKAVAHDRARREAHDDPGHPRARTADATSSA